MGIADELARRFDTAFLPGARRRILAGAAIRSRQGMATMPLADATIRYRIVGDGPLTLVFAADPPIVIEHYDDLLAALPAAARIVIMEVPGFGFSLPQPSMRFDFDAANRVIEQFLERLALGPYVLAFPCVTAYAAVAIAARRPDLVHGAVLIQAPGWAEEIRWKKGRDPKGLLGTPLLGQVALRALKRQRAPDWFRAAVGHRPHMAAITATADRAFAGGACFCLASAFQRYLTDTAPPLPPLAIPALVVWGTADRSHAATDRSTSAELAPGARVVDIADAGHFPELEQPETFALHLGRWLDETFPATS